MTLHPKPARKHKQWQQKIEKKVKAENINLRHPKGKERFEEVIKNELVYLLLQRRSYPYRLSQ
jgi:hypothetical protein